MYNVYNEDCISGMKKLADNSIDFICADLPYNLTDCAWDKSVIDLAKMWAEFKRILKPYSVAALFASGKFKKADNCYHCQGDWKRRGTLYIQEQTNYPSDVLEFKTVPATKKLHPTQKPTALLEYLIKTYSNAGEAVLDATCGSGSTGVAAINTGRRFIGFELEKKFYDIAEKRISEAVAKREQSLFKLEA